MRKREQTNFRRRGSTEWEVGLEVGLHKDFGEKMEK